MSKQKQGKRLVIGKAIPGRTAIVLEIKKAGRGFGSSEPEEYRPRKGYVTLCVTPNSFYPFVTWWTAKDSFYCSDGNYFKELKSAILDYKKRNT